MADEITRREFVKKTVVGTAVLAGTTGALPLSAVDSRSKQIAAALGATFIPTGSGDPGYKELEAYGITDYVMKDLPEEGLEGFSSGAKQFFDGKTFLELDDKQREQYLELVIDGSRITGEEERSQLQTFYRAARNRVLSVYYKNFPESALPRTDKGEIIHRAGDTHQISNPNTKKMVTGWDVAGYQGPLDLEEEQRMRTRMKNILPHWYEGDFVKLTNAKPAAPAVKTSAGHNYYDVLVVGGGTAGCVVAGRLAERGINPKTGDRLRIAMIEGGDDWPIRDAAIRPGYGAPVRRSVISNVSYDERGPEGSPPADPSYRWPYEGENFKVVGGCSLHYGGNTYLPGEDDFHWYRQTTGVDWTLGKFTDAIEEIRTMYSITVYPPELESKGVKMFNDAGRSMGYDMKPCPVARRNCLGCRFCSSAAGGCGMLCRQDSKGNSLPWAYIGLNNGLEIIANAEVDRILIEKPGDGRPVATGVVYKDKAGKMHEVRAARVIVASGAVGTPLLLYRSGYGPRDYLGSRLIVENKNVGRHFDGDVAQFVVALFPEAITPDKDDLPGIRSTPMKPPPHGELSVEIIGKMCQGFEPHVAALHRLSPQFGWKHKEFMRGKGRQRFGTIQVYWQMLPWEWRVTPDGKTQNISVDHAKFDPVVKETMELTFAWFEKMAIPPVDIDRRPPPPVPTPGHNTGTARAGASPENSVCSSDFDCHDIDHLMFTSGASNPRTLFSHGCGPAAVNGAYAWRRFIENHFSRGSSTRGYA
jgi:choline dehydrogenase-like flavoprotein